MSLLHLPKRLRLKCLNSQPRLRPNYNQIGRTDAAIAAPIARNDAPIARAIAKSDEQPVQSVGRSNALRGAQTVKRTVHNAAQTAIRKRGTGLTAGSIAVTVLARMLSAVLANARTVQTV